MEKEPKLNNQTEKNLEGKKEQASDPTKFELTELAYPLEVEKSKPITIWDLEEARKGGDTTTSNLKSYVARVFHVHDQKPESSDYPLYISSSMYVRDSSRIAEVGDRDDENVVEKNITTVTQLFELYLKLQNEGNAKFDQEKLDRVLIKLCEIFGGGDFKKDSDISNPNRKINKHLY